MSLLIAVAAHALVIGAGAYFFRDYVFSSIDNSRSANTLTQRKLERAVEDSPIISPAFSMAGAIGSGLAETEVRSEGWEQAFSDISSATWWSWQADPRLAAGLNVPADLKRP